jgi:hypothetical protein
MNQETKGTDDIDRMESKSGIALARMNARIQKKKKKKRKIVPMLVQIIHVYWLFLPNSC